MFARWRRCRRLLAEARDLEQQARAEDRRAREIMLPLTSLAANATDSLALMAVAGLADMFTHMRGTEDYRAWLVHESDRHEAKAKALREKAADLRGEAAR